MKNIITLRHGNYNYKTGDLTEFGTQQIKGLYQFLKETLHGSSYIISSDRLRTLRSAWILKDSLYVKKDIEILDELCCEGDELSNKEAKAIHRVVENKKRKADNLIISSHFAVAQGYPSYFTKKENWEKPIEIDDIGKGRAVYLNLENKVWSLSPIFRT